MKTKRMIITVAALLALIPTSSAQKQIKEAFADIEKYSGVTKTGEQVTSYMDVNGIAVESKVVTIKVKGRNAYRAVFDKVKEAFDKEGKKSSWAVVEDGFEGIEIDSAAIHDLGLRSMWSIWRERTQPILIGNMKNSTYRLQNFDDEKHPGYRTCYAAEWSKSDSPDIYTAQLVYVYGRKPEAELGLTEDKPLNYSATVKWPNDQLNDAIKRAKQLQRQHMTFGIDTAHVVPKEFREWMKTIDKTKMLQDIPFDGDMPTWMNKAMNNVKHLSNSDWHRFFGLLTQQMIDRANKDSKEDMVVAASLILDLCKNAPLDDDERKVAANRLVQVSEYFDNDKNYYIFEMIELARKKILDKK